MFFRGFNTGPFWRIAFVCTLASCIFSFTTAIAAEQTKRGYKGEISKEELITELEKVQSEDETYVGQKIKYVEGYVINGDDIIDIIQKGYLTIQIKNAVIENGLDFHRLKSIDINEAISYEDDETRKERLQEMKHGHIEKIFYVIPKIEIIDSDINSRKIGYSNTSIQANYTIFTEELIFRDCNFNSYADFSSTFLNRADFSSTTFKEKVNFASTAFNSAEFRYTTFDWADFEHTTFEWADFTSATFRGNTDFTGATFNSKAGFSNVSFVGDVEFLGATFLGPASSEEVNFSKSTFGSMVNFRGASFNQAKFSKAVFKEAKFNYGVFNMVDFRDATIQEAQFSNATFNHPNFERVIFKKIANFREANFTEAKFSGASFDKPDFESATFNEFADFSRASFKEADFRNAHFDGKADFSFATFSKLAYFNQTKFNNLLLFQIRIFQYANFRNSQVKKLDFNSSASPSVVHGRVDFRNAMIGTAHFQDVVFENSVDFSDVHFGILIPSIDKNDSELQQDDSKKEVPSIDRTTIFRFVTFEKESRFSRVKFYGDVALENVIFKGHANFTDANFGKGTGRKISFSYLSFNGISLEWESLPAPDPDTFTPWVNNQSKRVISFSDKEKAKKEKKSIKEGRTPKKKVEQKLEPLSKVFGQLEDAFRAQKKLDDANQAYYFKKLAKRNESQQKNEFWAKMYTEVEYYFWGLPAGYGTKIWNILFWAALLNLLFTLLYYSRAKLHRGRHPNAGHEFNFRLRVLDFPKQFYAPNGTVNKRSENIAQLINALRFSSVVLFKIGYRDITASGTFMGLDLRYVVGLEWLLGYFVLAAILVTMSNTVPLVNTLITGMF
jgi:uncharacterized protein YjbI with pentapeptide repeats